MSIINLKIGLSLLWVAGTVVGGLALGVASSGGLVMLASFGMLPPLALALLWNEPALTMTERINQGRR